MEDNFALTDLPEDWRVKVDSHSSSPIFADERQQVKFSFSRTQNVDGEDWIGKHPLPNKESAKASVRERKKQGKEMQKQLLSVLSPEGKDKAIEGMLKGHGKH